MGKEKKKKRWDFYLGIDTGIPILPVSDITFEKIHSFLSNIWVTFPESVWLSFPPLYFLVPFNEFLSEYFPWLYIDFSPNNRLIKYPVRVKKRKEKKNVSPTPEGPIRENNIQRFMISTVPKQRWWSGGSRIGTLVIGGLNNWPINTIKHEIKIRDLTRVLSQQLKNAP